MRTQAVPLETRIVRAILLYFLIGASVSAAVQSFFLVGLVEFVSRNVLPTPERVRFLVLMAAGGGAAVLVPSTYVLLARTEASVDRAARLANVLSPLMLAFLVPLLFD